MADAPKNWREALVELLFGEEERKDVGLVVGGVDRAAEAIASGKESLFKILLTNHFPALTRRPS